MIKVEKNGVRMAAKDGNQLAAFLNNGWKKIENEPEEKAPEQPQETKLPEYKKSDISRMNVEDLRKLAAELGIDGAEESTGEALKAAIIEKLGL